MLNLPTSYYDTDDAIPATFPCIHLAKGAHLAAGCDSGTRQTHGDSGLARDGTER